MAVTDTWMWVKRGDHVAEFATLCERFVLENGQRAGVDPVHGRKATPSPIDFTSLHR